MCDGLAKCNSQSLAAGIPAHLIMRVCMCGACVACVQPVYPEGVVHPCALVDAMVGCSLAGEVVEATASKLLSNPT